MQIFPERRLIRRETDPQLLNSPIVSALHRYWLSKHVDGRLPSRSDIDPADIKPLLPNVLLGNIQWDPFRVFYRLVGTRIVEFRGELTGHYLDSVSWLGQETRTATQDAYQMVAQSRRPTFAEIELLSVNDLPHKIVTGLWPLATKHDGPVDMFIAAEDYGDLERRDFGL